MRIQTLSRDELGELAKALNRMADRIQHTEIALQKRVTEQNEFIEQMNSKLLTRNERLAELFITDSLTGLLNRREFERLLAKEWRVCARSETWLSQRHG